MISPSVQVFRALILWATVLVAFGQPSASPGVGDLTERRGLSTGRTIGGQVLAQGDLNHDQQLSRSEMKALAGGWYQRLNSGGTGRVGQEEFLAGFERLLQESPDAAQPRIPRARFGPSPYLGLFVAIDQDKDGALTVDEFTGTWTGWFDQWSGGGTTALELENLGAGISGVLPRTNLGRGISRTAQTRIPGLPEPPPAPVLPPEKAIGRIEVPLGFHVELAASEPMIEDPVAISFDPDGRLYVVEMRSFMLDIDRSGEGDPISRISLLEDLDHDGRFDKSTVFLDGLVLPRSVSAMHGGVLYVSDYKLHFARDDDGDGRADLNVLVDPDYGPGDIEHAPNGLMLALDNWIYNGGSSFRYRWIGDRLVKQSTERRGQWGMTQDNVGRLLYNVNNSQLLGDFTPPNYMGRNPHHITSAGLNLFVATDQRVFPIRMNTAVNRGYLPEVLDSSGRLHVFASSCSPVVYRGDNYPLEFVGNAFVCDPVANLVKRNLLFDDQLTLRSRFAYDDSEFLVSTDERFRPVNLVSGPDGALWVVDMYRGISQHGAFMTPYLRRESLERGLDQGIHYGRIYRVVSDSKRPAPFPRLAALESSELVSHLAHSNGWMRDTAQRLLVERAHRTVLPDLLRVVKEKRQSLERIHALWTLEGILLNSPGEVSAGKTAAIRTAGAPASAGPSLVVVEAASELAQGVPGEEVLTACFQAMGDVDTDVQVAAIRVAESLTSRDPAAQQDLLARMEGLASSESPEVCFQLALTAGNLPKPAAFPTLIRVASRHAQHALLRHAILSGLNGWELQFLQIVLSEPGWVGEQSGRGALLEALAAAVIRERDPQKCEMLLLLIASQEGTGAWRQTSLVEGVVGVVKARRFQPIELAAAPKMFAVLSRSENVRVREAAARLPEFFAWPGNPRNPTAPAPQEQDASPEIQSLNDAGKTLFRQVCAACHGLNGEGLRPLAPPLTNSAWVSGSPERLIRIVLNGVSGPIHVDGRKYEPPGTLPDMPALREALDDAQIASVLTFIRTQWGAEVPGYVRPDQIKKIRTETQERELPWTEDELLQIK